MDGELVAKVVGVGVSLALGAGTKHRTKIPQKAVGPVQNQVVGQAAVAVVNALGGDMTPADGVQIGIATEAVYNVGRSVRHLVGLARGIGRAASKLKFW